MAGTLLMTWDNHVRGSSSKPQRSGMGEFWGNGRAVSLYSRSPQAHKENRSRNGLHPGKCRRAFDVTTLCQRRSRSTNRSCNRFIESTPIDATDLADYAARLADTCRQYPEIAAGDLGHYESPVRCGHCLTRPSEVLDMAGQILDGSGHVDVARRAAPRTRRLYSRRFFQLLVGLLRAASELR
jgi:hypothetical protein